MGQKLKNLKFDPREKLDHHFKVKFHSESNSDSLNALKRCLDPEMDHEGPIWDQNRKILAKKKLNHRIRVKFHRKSNGDSLEALKLC